MSVAWKKGRSFNADAEKVYSELQNLGEEIKPEDIVKYAEDETSELHKCFTWDDTEAAAKWRKHEARQIMVYLVYTPDDEPKKEEQRTVRVFFSLDGENKHYEPTKVIVKNQDKYEQLLAQARRELQTFKAKYSMLKELDAIFALIG